MARSTKPQVTVNLPDCPDPLRGGGAWSLGVDHVEMWAWKQNVFTADEAQAIIEMGTRADLDKATTFGPSQDDRVRNSFVQFLYPNELTGWVFARLAGVINEINNQFFGFDLTALEQGLQFTRYTAPGEHYHWHIDRGFMTATRKLSVSIQLNDPNEYKGGDLQFKFGKQDTTVQREQGLATFFPSYTLHRVKPVTEGTRYSLVAWIGGPPFK